jgi:hypothetical protein
MSQVLIHEYLAELDRLKRTSGRSNESIVREAFKDLLKAWGGAQDLVFVAEYPLKTAAKANITVDGALLHSIRTPLGYWEAKDEDDDLAEEIASKFKKGYRFADHKERVLDLLARVARVSVETVRIVEVLKAGPR